MPVTPMGHRVINPSLFLVQPFTQPLYLFPCDLAAPPACGFSFLSDVNLSSGLQANIHKSLSLLFSYLLFLFASLFLIALILSLALSQFPEPLFISKSFFVSLSALPPDRPSACCLFSFPHLSVAPSFTPSYISSFYTPSSSTLISPCESQQQCPGFVPRRDNISLFIISLFCPRLLLPSSACLSPALPS